mmetsp:Transcript_29828/g.85801  ORF Transcript_29828/g.85801 Transcript_29828/m.85801 type:complete len:344 (+) Transcript_29828:611-1642(+)
MQSELRLRLYRLVVTLVPRHRAVHHRDLLLAREQVGEDKGDAPWLGLENRRRHTLHVHGAVQRAYATILDLVAVIGVLLLEGPSGRGEGLELPDPRVFCRQVLVGIPRRGPEAFEAPVSLESLPRRRLQGSVHLVGELELLLAPLHHLFAPPPFRGDVLGVRRLHGHVARDVPGVVRLRLDARGHGLRVLAVLAVVLILRVHVVVIVGALGPRDPHGRVLLSAGYRRWRHHGGVVLLPELLRGRPSLLGGCGVVWPQALGVEHLAGLSLVDHLLLRGLGDSLCWARIWHHGDARHGEVPVAGEVDEVPARQTDTAHVASQAKDSVWRRVLGLLRHHVAAVAPP